MVSKILDLITINYSAQRSQDSKDVRRIRILQQQAKSDITIPLGNEDRYDNKEGNSEEHDSNAVF